MAGRRRVGARHAPRHARPSATLGVAVVSAAGIAALTGAVLLANAPAGAEAGTTTATLTLTGVRDSNCDFSTGGTTVYVKPGGDVRFKAELAGIKVKVAGLPVDLSTAKIASFNDKLIIDGHKKSPKYVSDTKTYVWQNVSAGTHKIEWSANSVTLLSGLLNNKVTIPLNGDTVLPKSLPVGGQLNWVGSVKASNQTKCGISLEIPGAGVTVGPIHGSLPPITTLPTLSVPNLPSLPHLPGGGSSSSAHHPGNGGGSTSHAPPGGGTSQSSRPTTIPELVVPNAGSGGDSAFGGGGGIGGLGGLPGAGSLGPIAPAAVTSTASGPSAEPSKSPKPVDLATNKADDGLGGPQLPVLLAIVAIIALSLVTATYARMYLLRKPPGTPAA